MNAVLCEGLTIQLGDHVALRDLSFELEEENFLAIMGPNGAGKSTLIRAMLGLVPPGRGQLSVLGHPPGKSVLAEVGYVPQIKTLDRRFPAMPLELVVTGVRPTWPWRIGSEARGRALAAMSLAGIEHKIDTPINRLSGGELQRVYLARAFARQPRMVLLDEPATGMDRRGEADMYSLLEAYRREHRTTIVMITHDWEAARHHATHVLLLDRRMIGFGPPAKALDEENLRTAFGHVGHHHSMSIVGGEGHHHGHSH